MTISTNGPNHSMIATQPYSPPISGLAPAPAPVPMAEPVKSHESGLPVIRVFGVGGGGCNAVERMCQDNLGVVQYFAINTDAQHLQRSRIGHRIAIGESVARGLGVGGHPEVGAQAAEENTEELTQAVAGSDMVFIAAGMGGGTGTGAAPVLARIAKESGALTVAVVSRPFSFEAAVRQKNAEEGIARLREHVDTLIIIPKRPSSGHRRQGQQSVHVGRSFDPRRLGAAAGNPGHSRSGNSAGRDQRRFRRREVHHVKWRQRMAGHWPGRGPPTGLGTRRRWP